MAPYLDNIHLIYEQCCMLFYRKHGHSGPVRPWPEEIRSSGAEFCTRGACHMHDTDSRQEWHLQDRASGILCQPATGMVLLLYRDN